MVLKCLTVFSSFFIPLVDGQIHSAAGPMLLEENKSMDGCKTGAAVISCGYRLPAKCKYLT